MTIEVNKNQRDVGTKEDAKYGEIEKKHFGDIEKRTGIYNIKNKPGNNKGYRKLGE